MKFSAFKSVMVAGAIAVGLVSCETIEKDLDIPLGINNAITIPVIDSVGTFTLEETPIDINIDSVLSANGASRSNIKSLKLTSITVSAINANDTVNLGVFKDFVFSAAIGTGAFEEIAAVKDNPDANTDVTVSGNSGLDLMPYFDGDGKVKVIATNRKALTSELQVNLKYDYNLAVGL